MGHVTRFLSHWHFFRNNLRPRGLKYPVEHSGNYYKGIKEGSYIPKFLEKEKTFVLKIHKCFVNP